MQVRGALPWTFRSTFSHIIGLQMLAIAATSLIMPLAIFMFLNRTVASYQLDMLRRHEQGLLRGLSVSAPGAPPRLEPAVRSRYGPGNGGFAFTVLDARGAVLLSSQPDGQALTSVLRAGDQAQTFKRQIGAANYIGASFPETLGGRRIWIQVGQNLEDPDVVLDDVLARFLPQVGWLSVSLLLLLLLIDVLIVRRALAPVRRASTLAEAITPSRIDVRLPLEGMPQEIAPMVQAVNAALDRLERGFRAQRDLTADVAHELRTPLTVLRMRIDALPDPQIRAALHPGIDLMGRIVSQLLAIAELETVVVDAADRADLRAVCLEAAEHLAPLAILEHKQIELEGASAPVWVRGQHDFLFQAVRNLVENAIAHTPSGSVVGIEVHPQGEVRVLDRGPGVPPDQRALLFQRFWRRRDRASAAGAGAGLGLSIVARIAEQHGGAVAVDARRGGGAVFVLGVPLADAP
jgi:signal transduction histidine kinase